METIAHHVEDVPRLSGALAGNPPNTEPGSRQYSKAPASLGGPNVEALLARRSLRH
ncbi:hypothetical protein BDV10DRAFT_143776 [Aspergillus recurvatus]